MTLSSPDIVIARRIGSRRSNLTVTLNGIASSACARLAMTLA
jgi:hypothetical protein